MVFMKGINEKQKKAIEFGKGQLLIIAGAGTGKTTVITERIKRLIEKKLAKPSEILALTFTEKASDEMQARVDEMMPYGYFNMWIMTFHSFCDRILRAEAVSIGINPKYKLMSKVDEISLIRKHLFDFDLDYFRPLGNPTKFIQGLLEHFSRLSDEDVSSMEYIKYASKYEKRYKGKGEEFDLEIKKTKELAQAYLKYQEIKLSEDCLNFSDLIYYTLDLFRKRKNILKNYQYQFKYLLVDEYQDTNITQNELIKLLSGNNGNITVVADDDQSIYKWRGASVSNVINFRKNFPKTKIITLTQNYRSTQEILDRAYDLIVHNNPNRLEIKEGIDKKLISQKTRGGEKIIAWHCKTSYEEANCVADEIINLIKKEENLKLSDIAILVRANSQADIFIKTLTKRGIPHQYLGPGEFLNEDAVVEFVSYLKVLINPDDSLSFYKLLGIEELSIPQKDIVKLTSVARRQNESLFEVSKKIDELGLDDISKEKINKLHNIIENGVKLIKKESVGKILFSFIEESGIKDVLYNPQNEQEEHRALTTSKLFEKIQEFEMENHDNSIISFLDWYELMVEVGESPQMADLEKGTDDAVKLITVHSSKGLEFSVVFLINLVHLRFPSTDKKEMIPVPDSLVKETLVSSNFHLEEERRLFYVGMTRAKEKLYFTFADYYSDGKRIKKVSPFVIEALGENFEKSKKDYEGIEQLSLINSMEEEKSIGNNSPREIPAIKINRLSVSQIETFEFCTLHYKLKYILRIPTPPTASQSFGISIHETLKDFYDKVKRNEKVTKDTLLESLTNCWEKQGYESKIHERKNFERANKMLANYYIQNFDPKTKILLLEQDFTLKLPLSKNNEINNKSELTIVGKIDRVDKVSENVIEVIDYKTSKPQTEKEVQKELQLGFYALAAHYLKEYPFNKKPEEILLSFIYLETGEKITIQKTKEELDKTIKTIYEYRDKIENSNFSCTNEYFCKSCEYKGFCR